MPKIKAPKLKSVFICQQCGSQSVRWVGRCPSCQAWNSFVEEVVEDQPKQAESSAEPVKLTSLADVSVEDTARLSSGVGELDRVLGGGIVPGSVVLVGGDPGIGKSTLLLSVAGRLSGAGARVLYVSGEESLRQTKVRAMRLGLGESGVQMQSTTRLGTIEDAIRKTQCAVAIVDSIQVIESDALTSAAGSISQVRECAHALTQLVKGLGTSLFLVGHVTKEGTLAGPKVLEHLVDTVLYFEGEQTSGFRLLRCTKNRFGHTSELGVFHMTGEGLVEVTNPSEFFLSDRPEPVPGTMVTVSLEGSRPMLVETQALTSPCAMGLPRRRTTGLDVNRVTILLAVLERRARLTQLASQDVFVSSLGGVRVVEPASDLAIALAVASSLKEQPTKAGDAAIGEVGLTGEVRPAVNVIQRLHEAKRVGFRRVFVAAGKNPSVSGLTLVPVRHVREAIDLALQ